MSSVTNRIKEIKQPRGGYLNPNSFEEIELKDKKDINQQENIHASIVGMAVDYLSRLRLHENKEEAFKISVIGARMMQESDNAYKLLTKIKGLDDESISSACKLVGYDVCFRAGKQFYKPVEEINPDKQTIENIRIMVERAESFFREYGPVVDVGMTFNGGYTQTISSGDADFMTEDTLWDFKVSKNKPSSTQTLQLLVYYLLGMHSDKEKYSKIKKIGIYNPRLNKVFIIEVNKISDETIKNVESKVIVYRTNNFSKPYKIRNDEEFFTITDLTKILKCSRYRIMQLYSIEGLPLQKMKNKYVIDKVELTEWIQEKEDEEKERKKQEMIFNCVGTCILLIMIIGLVVFFKVVI